VVSTDVVAEDGDGVTWSAAISLPLADDAAFVREATSVRSDSGPCTGFTSTTYIAASSRARGDEADAEDLVAETFLAAFRAATPMSPARSRCTRADVCEGTEDQSRGRVPFTRRRRSAYELSRSSSRHASGSPGRSYLNRRTSP